MKFFKDRTALMRSAFYSWKFSRFRARQGARGGPIDEGEKQLMYFSKVTLVLLLQVSVAADVPNAAAKTPPPIDIETGWEIPSEGYCDQPYVVKLKRRVALCDDDRQRPRRVGGQHVVATRSRDKGRSWSPSG